MVEPTNEVISLNYNFKSSVREKL